MSSSDRFIGQTFSPTRRRHGSPGRRFQVRPALRAFNSAVKINPNFYGARIYRAAILFHDGFHEIGMEDNNEATLVAPEFALPYALKGFIAQYEGDHELADHYYQLALARTRHFSRQHTGASSAYLLG
ncbi:MAG: tetratricopeptide repeat protein [Candidatus Acidiferrum sp.]|jgi:tetratricopeptide (TPR) repeat protein